MLGCCVHHTHDSDAAHSEAAHHVGGDHSLQKDDSGHASTAPHRHFARTIGCSHAGDPTDTEGRVPATCSTPARAESGRAASARCPSHRAVSGVNSEGVVRNRTDHDRPDAGNCRQNALPILTAHHSHHDGPHRHNCEASDCRFLLESAPTPGDVPFLVAWITFRSDLLHGSQVEIRLAGTPRSQSHSPRTYDAGEHCAHFQIWRL